MSAVPSGEWRRGRGETLGFAEYSPTIRLPLKNGTRVIQWQQRRRVLVQIRLKDAHTYKK